MVPKTWAGDEENGHDDPCPDLDEPREPVDDFTLERVATYVTRFPGRTLAQVQHRLELSTQTACNAARQLRDEDRVAIRRSTQTTAEHGADVYLLTPATVRYWDDDVTRPLFEDTVFRALATHITRFPGRRGRGIVRIVNAKRRPRKALRRLRRLGLVETTWGLHGRRYYPVDRLLAWCRELEGFTESYEYTPLGIAQALQAAERRYEERQREHEAELEQAREHERSRRRRD